MKAAFHTLGCKTNAYETQAVLEQFEAAGFEIGNFADACDVYVINSCAVTAEAARKSRQMAGRCKKKNPDAFVVVTGCYAQEAAGLLIGENGVDLVVGNSEKSHILALVSEKMSGQAFVKDLSHCREYEDQKISGQGDHIRAYVKIQDGCDRFCSYCLIPYLRGRSRSRAAGDILSEVRELARSGFHEIVLTGIDISTYVFYEGRQPDAQEYKKAVSGGKDLARLIRKLDETDGIERIRLGSLEEGIISEEFIRELKDIPSFCPQFHLSLQSGSDTVLKRMNRKYTSEDFLRSIILIRNSFPEAGITTDIICGFPGETEGEFGDTVQFVRDAGFSRLHVFPYSRRKKTRADLMPGQLSRAVKEERCRHLIEVGEVLKEEYESRLIGRNCRILAEEVVDNGEGICVAGYTPEYVRILFPVQDRQTAEELINRTIDVIPRKMKDKILIG